MKKITKNIQVKVASNKKKVSGNILNAPKTHKLPRVVKAKAGQTITGKIGGIRKTANKSIANCLNYLNDEIIRDFTFTLKEHPIRKFNQKIQKKIF